MCSTIVYLKYFQHFISADTTTSEIEGGKSETTGTTKTEDIIESNEENKTHQERQDAEQVLHLMPLMLFFPIFWTLYDQQGSVWTLQATHLNCHGLEPEQSGVCKRFELTISLNYILNFPTRDIKLIFFVAFLMLLSFPRSLLSLSLYLLC